MLRPVTLRCYLTVMRAKGYAAKDVLEGSGIDAARIDDENYLIELAALHRVVDNMIRLHGDSGIGLDVGLQYRYSDFGILGFAVLSGQNLLQNLEELWRHNETVGVITKVSVVKVDRNRLHIDIDVMASSERIYRFFIEETLTLLINISAEVRNHSLPLPEKIEFAFPEPPYGDRYRDLFRCPVYFGAERSRATFRREWFEQPLQTSNPELRKFCDQRLEQLRQEMTTASPVSLALGSIFAERKASLPTLEAAARALGVSSRTLSRQLHQQKTSYRKEIERYKISLALDCIRLERKSAKEVSAVVGFSDVNTFRRAFKRWTGMTVSEYRDCLVQV